MGRKAIVTGGSRGLGRAIVQALATDGWDVAFNYQSNKEAADSLLAELAAKGATAYAFQADVADATQAAAFVENAKKALGDVDALVNNAGITRDKLLARMSEEDWQMVLNINLNSVFHCSKAAARIMAKQRAGRIINIASVVGVIGNAGQCNYSASKAGIIGLSKSLAREIGSRGVTVNCIAPGFIATAMTDVLPEDVKAKLMESIPLGRLGLAEDVAQAALFLASPGAAYVTGHVLHVDGGMAM
jgi:3-oxoacyl-[acyl-carrier protein] reductase